MTLQEELHALDLAHPQVDNIYSRMLDYLSNVVEVDEVQQKERELEIELDDLEDKVAKLEDDVDNLETDLRDAEDTIRDLREQLDRLSE